jgi:SAM-dependent methyltransferase
MSRGGARRRSPPAHDRHALYELAVQSPEVEVAVLDRLLDRAGQPALRLREDFSGTAALAAAWVLAGPERSAVAVDADPAVLTWALRHRFARLGPAARRLDLVCADVRRGPRGPFDVVVALNFSWQVLHERSALLAWLRSARRALAPGGVLLLDLFGGWKAQQVLRERRRLRGGVTYVWEHAAFDAITHRIRCAIHFELPGGRVLRNAFTYDWRLWTLPEVKDILAEAGFEPVEVLWDVKPQGVEPLYLPRVRAENHPGWIAYVSARRPT